MIALSHPHPEPKEPHMTESKQVAAMQAYADSVEAQGGDAIQQAIAAWWGPRCQESAEGCPTCEAWRTYDALVAPRAADRGGDERGDG